MKKINKIITIIAALNLGVCIACFWINPIIAIITCSAVGISYIIIAELKPGFLWIGAALMWIPTYLIRLWF